MSLLLPYYYMIDDTEYSYFIADQTPLLYKMVKFLRERTGILEKRYLISIVGPHEAEKLSESGLKIEMITCLPKPLSSQTFPFLNFYFLTSDNENDLYLAKLILNNSYRFRHIDYFDSNG